MQNEQQTLEQEFKKLASETARARLGPVLNLAPDNNPSALVEMEVEAQTALQNIAQEVEILNQLNADAKQLDTQIGIYQNQIKKMSLAAQAQPWVGAVARIGIPLAIFLGGGWWFWGKRSEIAKDAEIQRITCPRCRVRNSLIFVPNGTMGADGEPLNMVECQEQDCHYQFEETYLGIERLSFSTIGVVYSGKTMAILHFYNKLKKQETKINGSLKLLPCEYGEIFEQMIQEVLEAKETLRPTLQDEIPSPFVCHFESAGRCHDQVLANILDFTGEVANQKLENPIRNRALACDGVVLCIDPTQIASGKGARSTLQDQIKKLNEFLRDLKVIRRLPPGEKIPLPIAICVTKIDEIPSKNPWGGGSQDWLELLAKSDQYEITLKLIQKRSNLLRNAFGTIFPGWQIEQVLTNEFDPKRIMYFPVASKAFDSANLDLAPEDRAKTPFGVMEPILWLLYMHGYDTLNKD